MITSSICTIISYLTPYQLSINLRKEMKPIGFVGLGIMGKGMIKNLLTKIGAPMVVWNRC
jgi:hypothetical protein